MTAPWAQRAGSDTRVTVRVQPRASRTEVAGPHGDTLRIRLASPPVDGAANRELIAFMSKRLRRPRSAITLLRGERNRRKTLSIKDVTPTEVVAALSSVSD